MLKGDWSYHLSQMCLICYFSGNFDLRTICNALVRIETKWFRIGIQLGIPRSKLEKFKKDEDDPLSAVVDYWLQGNITESVSPISWNSIVAALKSEYVGEPGLAEKISKKYCEQEDTKIEKGATINKQVSNQKNFTLIAAESKSSAELKQGQTEQNEEKGQAFLDKKIHTDAFTFIAAFGPGDSSAETEPGQTEQISQQKGWTFQLGYQLASYPGS